jgi:hypothetical protein
MDLLLTWSGTASHEIATFFRDWLPKVVPGVKPWISSQDIAKGKRWADELTAQMSRTNLSITLITPENLRSPWVYYEVGFIAAKLDEARVCPLLIGVESAQVRDTPLGQYQWTEANRDDVLKLIKDINGVLGDRSHDVGLLEGNFSTQWPSLKRRIDKVIVESPRDQAEVIETEASVEEQLSEEARRLLVAASKDDYGQILHTVSTGGASIQTNGENLIGESTARCHATWKSALDELLEAGLVREVGYKGEVFEVTRQGYDIADLIESRNPSEPTSPTPGST